MPLWAVAGMDYGEESDFKEVLQAGMIFPVLAYEV